MARDTALIEKRNKLIKKQYAALEMKNPKWKYMALIDELSELHFLSQKTIMYILNKDD